MPNVIKYSLSAQTEALKKGNFWIGTGDVGKGPTSSSDYWQGITPPTGGYTIYLNKASQGPSIYAPTNDASLITLTNMIGSQSFTSVTQCFNWYNTQSDKMVFNRDYPEIITSGLVLNLDAGFIPSYSTSGVTWYDISPNGISGTLTNGPTFNSGNGGSIVLDGTNDYVNFGNQNLGIDLTSKSVCAWVYLGTLINLNGVIDKDFDNGGANYGGWGFWIQSNRKLWWWSQGQLDLLDNGPLSIGTNVWTMISVTYNITTKTASFYINTTLNSTRTNANIVDKSSGNMNLVIGTFRNGQGGYLNGRISGLYVYNRVLSTEEILKNYNATKSRFGL